MGRLRPISSPRTPIRGPASVLAAVSAVELALHRLQRWRESGMGPGSGAGATVEVASPSVPVNDRGYYPSTRLLTLHCRPPVKRAGARPALPLSLRPEAGQTVSPMGRSRMRLPVAWNTALPIAGATGGTPGSPTPEAWTEKGCGTMWVCTFSGKLSERTIW